MCFVRLYVMFRVWKDKVSSMERLERGRMGFYVDGLWCIINIMRLMDEFLFCFRRFGKFKS